MMFLFSRIESMTSPLNERQPLFPTFHNAIETLRITALGLYSTLAETTCEDCFPCLPYC